MKKFGAIVGFAKLIVKYGAIIGIVIETVSFFIDKMEAFNEGSKATSNN